MSDKESKNYTIEIILRYKSGEIFRDFEFLSNKKLKNYNLERILNKYIYDYFNSYFDDETKLNSIIDEFAGNINMKYDNNYLDVKIIEQILNSNNDTDLPSNYDKDKIYEKILERTNQYSNETSKIQSFTKDFINFISELFIGKFNYKSNKKYSQGDVGYVIDNIFIERVENYAKIFTFATPPSSKIKEIMK